MRRLTVPDGAMEPPAHRFRPVPSQKQWSSMRVVTLGWAFGMRPPVSVPNSRFRSAIFDMSQFNAVILPVSF
jgi:hypothetical protein